MVVQKDFTNRIMGVWVLIMKAQCSKWYKATTEQRAVIEQMDMIHLRTIIIALRND